MKTNYLFAALISSAMLYSCSGGDHEKTETVEATATTTEPVVEEEEEIYVINPEASAVNWTGTMLNVKSHNGTLKLKDGNLKLEGDQIVEGTFTADLTSMVPMDSTYDEEHTKEKLVGHLSSADFFAVDSFPTATFVVKSVEGNTIKGDLTVRGKTFEEEVEDVTVEKNGSDVKANGKLVFDRQKYGVAWESPMKDMVLGDDIELDVVLEGTKQ